MAAEQARIALIPCAIWPISSLAGCSIGSVTQLAPDGHMTGGQRLSPTAQVRNAVLLQGADRFVTADGIDDSVNGRGQYRRVSGRR